jgi:hypothetical protein
LLAFITLAFVKIALVAHGQAFVLAAFSFRVVPMLTFFFELRGSAPLRHIEVQPPTESAETNAQVLGSWLVSAALGAEVLWGT